MANKQLKKYRLEETLPVTRVYEIEAESEDAAMDIMNCGEVAPVTIEEGEDTIGVKITEIK